MKKSNTKLQLKTATVRVLQDRELTEIRGGDGGDDGDRRAPSNHPTACSVSLHCGPPGTP